MSKSEKKLIKEKNKYEKKLRFSIVVLAFEILCENWLIAAYIK